MPYGDGTGPLGLGRRGLGRGPCGKGLRRGYADGLRVRRYSREYQANSPLSREEEINILKKQKETIEQELNEIKKRIEEIEK